MTEREKLMELLSTAPLGDYPFGEQFSDGTVDKIADYLLKNGVIVPPCRVYDTIYLITDNGKIEEYTAVEIARDSCYGSAYVLIEKEVGEYSKTQMTCDFESFDVTAFTNRKEAEKALTKLKGEAK